MKNKDSDNKTVKEAIPGNAKSDGAGALSEEEITLRREDGKLVKRILIGLGLACVVMLIFMLVLDSSGAKFRRDHSKSYGYSVEYDETRYQKDLVRLDEKPTYMERIGAKDSEFANFMSISPISEETDLDEVLEAFESEYRFTVDESVRFGEGGYTAKRISYTDNEGEEPLSVEYYYVIDRKVVVTVSCDSKHKKELAKMLASFRFE
jgi:hypothetical protein